jgi:tRNA G26 N,N-dimethylase Trm1
LIDQELVKEQVHGTQPEPKAEEIDRQLSRIKSEPSTSVARPSWEAELASYELTEKILRKHIALELGELRLIDQRFRPAVEVSAAEIELYYQHELLPKVTGSAAPSLTEASDGIRKVLIEQKINQMMSSWLEALRRQARIQVLSAEPDRSAGELR